MMAYGEMPVIPVLSSFDNKIDVQNQTKKWHSHVEKQQKQRRNGQQVRKLVQNCSHTRENGADELCHRIEDEQLCSPRCNGGTNVPHELCRIVKKPVSWIHARFKTNNKRSKTKTETETEKKTP